MKSFILVVLLFGCAMASTVLLPAAKLTRAPEHDSAIIQSDRLGGNFAYSTVEGHAYKSEVPIIQNIVKPVAVTYETKLHPVPLTYVAGPPALPIAYAHHGLFV